MDCSLNVGKNIRDIRKERGMSQRELAEKCGFQDSVLSSYETGKKTPNLVTASTIAESLNVSIDQLYYGDENNRFVSSVPDDGRKIVNSVYLLWQKGVLISNIFSESKVNNKIHITYNGDVTLACYNEQIVWLLNRLGEFNQKKDSFPDPDAYIEMILSSAANEINKRIKSAEELRNTPRLSIGSSK